MADEVLWGKMRLGSFVFFHMRADPMSYMRCGEVTQVDHTAREFTVWFNIHRVPTSKGEGYNFERPLAETRLRQNIGISEASRVGFRRRAKRTKVVLLDAPGQLSQRRRS